jgi:asparagine synthase (glutamine-hydrolysing)
MCRLFGNIAFNSKKIDSTEFKKLTLLSKRGGPDSTEFYEDELVQFGFNRLAIIDTSSNGQQPIISPSGRKVLMLNGEIYNFQDLIRKYQLKGLRSGSDAEVVAHLIDFLSFEQLLQELDGMFAIAAWDTEHKELFLARDFAGIKPLFYATLPNGFIFGSQFDQILKHPWVRPFSWSETGLREFLQFGYMQAPHTIAQNVFQINVGEFMVYRFSENAFKTYSYSNYFNGESTSESETSDSAYSKVDQAIRKSVEDQLVADVPLGVFLSGGIDSALVTSYAAQYRPDIETLTIGFNDPLYDESSKASEYAMILNVKNTNIILSDSELLNIFDEHNQNMSEPLADYSSLPTYLVSKVAAQKFKVMLSGDGGDELFWGYPRFETFANSAGYFRIPGQNIRRGIKKVLKSSGKDITGFLQEDNLGIANRHFHSYLNERELLKMMPDSKLSETLIQGYSFSEYSKRKTLLYLRKNEFYFHLQKILVKVDRVSMANSLEVRVPMLSKLMLETAQRIEPELSQTHFELKYLLKKLLSDFIPFDLVEKKKKGFTPPLRVWSRGVLRDEIRDTIRSKIDFGGNNHIQDELITYTDQYMLSEHENLEGIWTFYVLCKWHQKLVESNN